MSQRTFTLGGRLLVAAALVFLTPGAGHAAIRVGGVFAGGLRGGLYRPYHWGYHSGWGSRPYAWGYSPYSYGYYPSYYGYYPYYSDPYLAPLYANMYRNLGPASDLATFGPSYETAPSSADGATLRSWSPGGGQAPSVSASPAQPDVSASLTVRLPAGARLWIDDQPTTLVGPDREFRTPPITPGRRYSYDLRATWYDGRQNVSQTQRVEITGGAHVNAAFPLPTETAGKASPVKND
jgi:uncharacterized protein (TIGR03000 family)